MLGPYVGRVPFLRNKIEQWRVKGEHLFDRWGVWTVAIGALSPLPYSITCWFAGIYNMPYRRFFLATLFRIPRIIAYYMIFRPGLALERYTIKTGPSKRRQETNLECRTK